MLVALEGGCSGPSWSVGGLDWSAGSFVLSVLVGVGGDCWTKYAACGSPVAPGGGGVG